jgi:hypothetical protein
VQGVRFELTNPLRPDLKPGAFDHSATPAQIAGEAWN